MTENPKKTRMKRKNEKTKFYNLNGKEITSCYCRKCEKNLLPRNFYKANDEFLDSNGYMSICKNCVSKIFMSFYLTSHSISSSIYATCKILNIAYLEQAVDATRKWIEGKVNKSKKVDGAYGFYKSKASGMATLNPEIIKIFDSYAQEIEDGDILEDFGVSEENAYELNEFWGEGLEYNDYRFLEGEYSSFKKTHKADTYSEKVLLKEVCFTLLAIRDARKNNKSTSNLVKGLQDIMKSLAISPSMANAADKSNDIFGIWIKEIEELSPAEWYQQHELFEDVDNINKYLDDYITRPTKNFVTGSRDFNISDEDVEENLFGE